jgi:peptidyl-prolyl cis-trans isomerase SurA
MQAAHFAPRLWMTHAVLGLAAALASMGAQAQTAATDPAANQFADYIVAIVNSEPVTNSEVRQRVLRAEATLRQQGRPVPPRAALSQQVLQELIAEKAQLQLARDSGIRVDDATLDEAEQSVARQNQLDLPALRARLSADGVSPVQFRDTLRNQILLTRLRERELERQVRVSDADIDRFLREQSSTVDPSLAMVRLGHVLVAVPEAAAPDVVANLESRAQQAAQRARAGDDFAALALEVSQGSEREQGGDMGARPLDRYPTLFAEAVAGRAVGTVVGPLRSGAGFHVLKVLDVQQAGGLPAAVTQTRARHILLRTGPQMTEAQARARLLDYRRRVASGLATFEALATEFSQDGSAARGGDLGWAGPGQFVPEFEDAMDSLRPGEVGQPVVSRFGVHLIQVVERRQAALTEAQRRELARNAVRERKLDEAYIAWAQEVRGRAYVELREPPQ